MNHLECEPTRTAYSFSEWPDHTKILGNTQVLRAGSSFPPFLMGIGQGDERKANSRTLSSPAVRIHTVIRLSNPCRPCRPEASEEFFPFQESPSRVLRW